MGITGLLPFLEKASTKGNISQFAGQTVAIDSYCWLHKGAFSCAEKLALGQPTDAYVVYCLRYINMLLAHKIKPILVFDGCHLPAKKDTESKRRELRDTNRRRAAELIKSGRVAEGKTLLRRSVDISHEMALNLIKTCHEYNVDCIVAPYEADSQLAYLNLTGVADVIITEDSDLTLFGCKKIFFKMDVLGNGVLVEQDRFHLAMDVRSEHFSMDKFRYMCILSGCDYLPSLPGIGLSKACKFIKKTAEPDMYKALIRLPSYLNMKSLDVTKEYRDAFLRADVTFKHQLVFCPFKRKQVRLTPPTPDVTPEQLHHAGPEMPDDLAWQLAIGNYDPMSLKKLHDYNPDTFMAGKNAIRTNSWKVKPSVKHDSIWSSNFRIDKTEQKITKNITSWPDTFGKVTELKTANITRILSSPKRNYYEVEAMEPEDLVKFYTSNESDTKKRVCQEVDVSVLQLNTSGLEEREKSPILVRRANPFAKETKTHEISPSLLDKGKQRQKFRKLARFKPTVIDNNVLTQSKFFARLTDASKELGSEACSNVTPVEPKTENTETPDRRSDLPLEVNKNIDLDRKSEENISVDESRMEIPQQVVIMEKSISVLDCTSNKMTDKISGISSLIEESLVSSLTVNTSDSDIYSDREINPIVNTENLEPVNGSSQSQSNSTTANLSQWSNNKIDASTAVLSIAALKSSSNGGTLRGMQGAVKTNRLPRTSVNRKFQPVKKKSQVAQGQQCLLSAFGFQKKTGLQH